MEESQAPVNPNVDSSNIPSTSPISSPINPPAGGPKSKLPIIIGIILFLLIAGSVAGFYVYKPQIMKLVSKPIPTPTIVDQVSPIPILDPTAGWGTYTNNKYNFSLKYPSSWKSYGSNNEERWSVTNPCNVFNYRENGCPNKQDNNMTINVSVEPNLSKMTANEYINMQKADLDKFVNENKGFDYLKDNIPASILPIGGRETIFANVQTVAGPTYKLTQIFDKDRIISVRCDECEKDFNDQILSTFKFTN